MARQINNQIERIYKIFESQLRVCLDNSDSTYDELRQFDETKANDEPIRVDYERSMKKFKQIEPFENELVNICFFYQSRLSLKLKVCCVVK